MVKYKNISIPLGLVFFILLHVPCLSQENTIDKIERISVEVEYIELSEFIYGIVNKLNIKQPNKPFIDLVESLSGINNKEIDTLLSSNNPKLRAVGLMALYNSDKHDQYLRVMNFLKDSAVCFKKRTFHHDIDLTVADIASSLIRLYFKQSRYSDISQESTEFIKERKHLNYTAGFLYFLKLKTTGRIFPFYSFENMSITEDQVKSINELKNRIDNIPNKIDRALYKLYLSADEYPFYTQEELKNELQLLGKDNIKRILERNPNTNDPDIAYLRKNETNNRKYTKMCHLILSNVKFTFQKNDVPYFLEQAKINEEMESEGAISFHFPHWYIAAIQLDPINEAQYISACLNVFSGDEYVIQRAEFYGKLVKIASDYNIQDILNWIYESHALNGENYERIDHFINNLDNKTGLSFLKKLIYDPRSETQLDVKDLISIARQINKIYNSEAIASQLIRDIRHPYGIQNVERWRDKAEKRYPVETTEMLENTKKLIDELRNIL